ncbi:MAG: 50S ribosomal protein L21 [Patescibacteria group bacterium]|nr:50S ribosomal protein L21 [Patescibacteria group bacterium]
MKYAVIKTGGKQYRVSEGETLTIEKVDVEEGKPVEFDQVLMLAEEGKVKLGAPTLEAKVKGVVINQTKDKKIKVSKYKAKTQYHRTIGHRQPISVVRIEKISAK